MLQSIAYRQLKTWVIDPSSTLYYRWLAVISAACLYNLIMIIARAVFWKLQEGNLLLTWLCLDYLCDIIYVLDIFVQFRTGQSVTILHRSIQVFSRYSCMSVVDLSLFVSLCNTVVDFFSLSCSFSLVSLWDCFVYFMLQKS